MGGDHLATARLCPRIRQARQRLSKRAEDSPNIRDPQIQALIPSSPGFAVVVASQPAPQRGLDQAPTQAPKQATTQVRSDPEEGIPRFPGSGSTTGQEPKEPSMQTPRQQTPTTPVVDWSAIQQVNLVNISGQLAASLPGDGEMDIGWDPATLTQNEPDSENDL